MIDINEMQKKAKATAANLNRWKKQGITEKVIAVDGLLTYCDEVVALCKRIKELDKRLEDCQKAIQKLAQKLNES